MIEQGIVALLSANAGLTALVGAGIYPVEVPEAAAMPCLSYQGVSASANYTLRAAEYNRKRIQFDAWGSSYADTRNVLQGLRDALDGYSGILTDGTRVLACLRGIGIDDFESDSRLFRAMQEYIFTFVEL